MRFVNPIQRVHDWLFPPAIMGGICPPPAGAQQGNNNPPVMVMGEMCPVQIQQPGPEPKN